MCLTLGCEERIWRKGLCRLHHEALYGRAHSKQVAPKKVGGREPFDILMASLDASDIADDLELDDGDDGPLNRRPGRCHRCGLLTGLEVWDAECQFCTRELAGEHIHNHRDAVVRIIAVAA